MTTKKTTNGNGWAKSIPQGWAATKTLEHSGYMKKITALVCHAFDIEFDDLVGGVRGGSPDLALARHVAVYLCETKTGAGRQELVRFFRCTLSSIENRIRRTRDRMATETRVARIVARIEAAIPGDTPAKRA